METTGGLCFVLQFAEGLWNKRRRSAVYTLASDLQQKRGGMASQTYGKRIKGMMVRRSYWILLISLAVLSVAVSGCITQSAAEPSDPTADVMPAPTDSATAPLQPTTVVGGAACPQPSEGQQVYVNESYGFCFLYPAAYTLTEQPDDLSVSAAGQPFDPNSIEPVIVSMRVNVVAVPGVASGITAADYAQEQLAQFRGEFPVGQEDGTIGGLPAVILNGMPGMGGVRQGYVVANDTLYELAMQPDPSDPAFETQQEGQAAWELVTSSIIFFPPTWTGEYISVEQACPAGDAGQVYIDRIQGYCFILPASFQPNPEWASQFMGGPALPNLPPEWVGPQQATLTIGRGGPAPSQSPEEIVAQIVANSTPGMVTAEDVIVGRQPAKLIKDASGPMPHWTIFVIAHGDMFSLLFQPTDFAAWPDAQQPVEEMYRSVIQTMGFFTPWR